MNGHVHFHLTIDDEEGTKGDVDMNGDEFVLGWITRLSGSVPDG